MSYIYKLSEDVPPSLREIFEDRGWMEWNSNIHAENEWNIMWTTKRYFRASSSYSLNKFQKLNHFYRTAQMTKKDNLTRNLKRMRANFGKIYNFYPTSYQFPLQYSEFVAMTHKNKLIKQRNLITANWKKANKNKKKAKTLSSQSSKSNQDNIGNKSVWIAKPVCGRRGENISLFTDVSEFNYDQPMIVQKYISNPLLIGGYKFDLRIYVLITSVRPLRIYCYNEGLCRFSTQQYDLSDLDNVYSHLTNSSINKTSDTFNKNKFVIGEGCKWTINKLFTYLQNEMDNDQNIKMMHQMNENDKEAEIKRIDIRNKIWNKIHDIIILTVLPIIMDVQQCSNCFELFGFDILVDEKYNCWLLEVNGSPAIAINSNVDKLVKYPMLNNLIDCIQNQFGSKKPNNKYRKHSKSSTKSSDDILLMQFDNMDLNNNQEDENKSFESIEPSVNKSDLFRNNVGGFNQIFPFNANTFESNKLLTTLSNHMISQAQKFKNIVVKEIKKKNVSAKNPKK